MKASVDISLYPLADEYIPAIKEFIERVQEYSGVSVVRNDLSTQLYGDYDQIMGLLKVELRLSWEKYGKGIFVIKFLKDDLRGLSSD
ncbi:hypothetical protein N9513_05505 [Gammaproteobacteria bacterium]|nr:hypothetical protein [bacterium]MDB4003917.1 hypothetical protein [Gammaproteobacteria bacterium]